MSKTRGKLRHPKELLYGALLPQDFDTVVLSAASPVNTAIQAVLPLAANFKIFRIVTTVFGTVTNATSFNIVYGTAAEGAVPPDDTFDTTAVWNLAVNGSKVLAADQALSTVSGTTQSWSPAVPEAIYPSGGALTLRLAGTTVTANLKVVVFGKFVDINPTSPEAQTTSGGAPHTFNAGTDPL